MKEVTNFQEKWIHALEKSVRTFVMVLITDMPTIKYWSNLGHLWILQKRGFLDNSGLVIHVLLHWKLLEGICSRYIQKILIIYTETVMIFVSNNHLRNICSWWRFFFNVTTINEIGKRENVLKHSHRGCVVGAFYKILHEGSIWNGTISILYFKLHKSIFLHFVRHGTKFYEKYIKYDDRKKYIDNDGSGIFSKWNVRQLYNAEYLKTYLNRRSVHERDYIKDTRIGWVHSGRKRKATGFVYLKGPPYHDAERSLHLRSFLHD